jgi:hypothetical protein
VFVADSADEPTVRSRIGEALKVGSLTGPDGGITRWQVHGSQADRLTDAENELAAQLDRRSTEP